MKSRPTDKLRTIKRAMNSDWSDHRQNKKIQNTCTETS